MCGLFGVLFCCARLCKGLLYVDGCKWRVGVVTCQFCGLEKVCSWGWDMLVSRRCSFDDFPCIGHIGL